MRNFLPILATLTLVAGLYAPAARAMVARRTAGTHAESSRVVRERASARSTAQRLVDTLLSTRAQELECGASLTGPVRPADPVARALESGWWLTPPADRFADGGFARSLHAGASVGMPVADGMGLGPISNPFPRAGIAVPANPGGWSCAVTASVNVV